MLEKISRRKLDVISLSKKFKRFIVWKFNGNGKMQGVIFKTGMWKGSTIAQTERNGILKRVSTQNEAWKIRIGEKLER